MKRKICIETSVISYLTARPARTIVGAAYPQITQDWWERGRDHYDRLISELVVRQCAADDPEAAQRKRPLFIVTRYCSGLASLTAGNGEAETGNQSWRTTQDCVFAWLI
jgi:hypothetical protein